jgi:hypothetical protein
MTVADRMASARPLDGSDRLGTHEVQTWTPNRPSRPVALQQTAFRVRGRSSGTFSAPGRMPLQRSRHTAAALRDGRVLITGSTTAGVAVASTELYDPVTGTFTATGSMAAARAGHLATLLADGVVLLAGTDASAELYGPATGTFSAAGQLTMHTHGSTATPMRDSRVLVAGGIHCTSVASAMLFTPESKGFAPAGSLVRARDGHTSKPQASGAVLIVGGISHMRTCRRVFGCTGADTVLSSAELFR